MAGQVTEIRVQKRDRDRVSIYLDGRFAFGLPAIVGARLRRGQFLSDADIASLQEVGGAEKAYNQALNYLSYRPRSRAEVVTYLQGREVPEEQVEAVVARLERAGLVDDVAFASFWVENREQFRPRGLRALRYELRAKGLGDDIIEQALASVDVADSAYRAAGRKVRQLSHLGKATFNRKLVDYMARRGFDYEVAQEVATRCWAELHPDA
jgi:regulatory protein